MSAPKTKIFVGHLPDGCTDDDLRNLFAKHGEVTECDVINKYGFVHMKTPEQAEEAVKNLNNYNLMGSSISVEPSKSKLHPEPGAPGRANKQTLMNRRGGGPARNGYGPPSRGGYGGGFSNGYRQFDRPPMGGGDSFYDRPFGFGRERMRPYPLPYERRSHMPPLRDDYPRRPLPPMGGGDPYSRPLPPMSMRDDLYERRPLAERSDYLYSRRSPPPTSSMRTPYWYDSVANGKIKFSYPPETINPTFLKKALFCRKSIFNWSEMEVECISDNSLQIITFECVICFSHEYRKKKYLFKLQCMHILLHITTCLDSNIMCPLYRIIYKVFRNS